ncbi:UNVERIFIED_CONTAM: hypothetical protein PYX00_009783 [Menopon gallinae]|uniref:Uncharacterized protein n=1 Tax=Menopon gallinae TaxID=328185 RepID=A0AAW2HD37_9NEOP
MWKINECDMFDVEKIYDTGKDKTNKLSVQRLPVLFGNAYAVTKDVEIKKEELIRSLKSPFETPGEDKPKFNFINREFPTNGAAKGDFPPAEGQELWKKYEFLSKPKFSLSSESPTSEVSSHPQEQPEGNEVSCEKTPENLGIVKSILGPSFEDAMLRTLEFGKALIQKNENLEGENKDMPFEKRKAQRERRKVKYHAKNLGEGDRGDRKSARRESRDPKTGRRRIVQIQKSEKDIVTDKKITDEPVVARPLNLAKIRSLDSELKQNASSPEKIKRQLEALIQINKDEPPECVPAWGYFLPREVRPMKNLEFTVMPAAVQHPCCATNKEGNCPCGKDTDRPDNDGDQRGGRREDDRSTRSAPTGLYPASEYIANALGPTLDLSIVDNLQLMRNLFRCDRGKSGERAAPVADRGDEDYDDRGKARYAYAEDSGSADECENEEPTGSDDCDDFGTERTGARRRQTGPPNKGNRGGFVEECELPTDYGGGSGGVGGGSSGGSTRGRNGPARDRAVFAESALVKDRGGMADERSTFPKGRVIENRNVFVEDRGGFADDRGGNQDDRSLYLRSRGNSAEDRGILIKGRGGSADDRISLAKSRGGSAEDRGILTKSRGGSAEDRGGLSRGSAASSSSLAKTRGTSADGRRASIEERGSLKIRVGPTKSRDEPDEKGEPMGSIRSTDTGKEAKKKPSGENYEEVDLLRRIEELKRIIRALEERRRQLLGEIEGAEGGGGGGGGGRGAQLTSESFNLSRASEIGIDEEIRETRKRKSSVKRNKSLLDAWDVFASKVCHTKLPSFSKVNCLERKSMRSFKGSHCCFPQSYEDQTGEEEPPSPVPSYRSTRSRSLDTKRPCRGSGGGGGGGGGGEKTATSSTEVDQIPYPLQRDVTCGMHRFVKTCFCNEPLSKENASWSSDDELRRNAKKGCRKGVPVQRSRSETARKEQCARLCKVLWAVTRINIFQDNSRTYEVMDATTVPPKFPPVKTEGVFVVKNPKKCCP